MCERHEAGKREARRKVNEELYDEQEGEGTGGRSSRKRCEANIYVDADKPFHLRQAHKISKVIASKIQL